MNTESSSIIQSDDSYIIDCNELNANMTTNKIKYGFRSEQQIYHNDHIDKFEGNVLVCPNNNDDNKNETVLNHQNNNCSVSKIYCNINHDLQDNDIVKIKHNDHIDILIGNRLHYPHEDHCDDHGRLNILSKINNDDRNTILNKLLNLWRFIIMIGLIGAFFCTELTIGFLVGSLSLQADAFHMLSDLIAMIMALYAQFVLKREESDVETFGMVRAEIVGGLLNGVFLIASCFFITIDAIERFLVLQPIMLMRIR